MTVSELIAALGGPTAVAGALGQKPGSVKMWSHRDALPAEHRLPLWRLALERGLAWEPPGAEGLRALLAQPAPAEAAE